MLPWELEDWLTDAGDVVVHMIAEARSYDALSSKDRLVYEFWLLDTEQRNDGISQYFCNNGRRRWSILSGLASGVLPSFASFAQRVDAVVGESNDPYQAVINSPFKLDELYAEKQRALVEELRAAVE